MKTLKVDKKKYEQLLKIKNASVALLEELNEWDIPQEDENGEFGDSTCVGILIKEICIYDTMEEICTLH